MMPRALPLPRVKFLLAVVDENATSFCHYETVSASPDRFMPIGVLRKTIGYARAHGLALQFLLGKASLPSEYESEIARVGHLRIIPQSCPTVPSRALIVINPSDYADHRLVERFQGKIAIIRIARSDVSRLSEIVVPLLPKCRRLNISLLEVERYRDEDIAAYKDQLVKLGDYLASCYSSKQSAEVNVLTDRLVLQRMSNCNAGVEHLTVAPDGRFYICPAFYYAGERAIGDVERGPEDFVNPQLFELEKAPVCAHCDTFQCKRCVFLNKKLTLEFNVPSWQQCKIAHAERAASRLFLSKIDWPIPEIDYDDPFEIAKI